MVDDRDADIETKLANGELFKLIRSRLGLELEDDTTLARARSVTLRCVCWAGSSAWTCRGLRPRGFSAVPSPRTKHEEEEGVRDLAQGLRSSFPFEYETIAVGVEAEPWLSPDVVPPHAPGGRRPWIGWPECVDSFPRTVPRC